MNRSIGSLRVAAVILLVFNTSNCLADFLTDSARLPTPDVPYQLVNPPVDFTYADAAYATLYGLELQAANFAEVEYPTIDFANDVWLLDSMFSVNYELQMSIGLGPVFPVFGAGQMHVVGSAPAGPDPFTRVFQLELVQLDLLPTAAAPNLPVLLRESPIYPSTGVTTVVDLCPFCGAFHWQVSSFFDVFAEISIDGGQTWTPSAGPLHLVQAPEPSTLVLLLLGLPLVRRAR